VIRRTAVAVDIQLSTKLCDRVVGRLTRSSNDDVSNSLTMRKTFQQVLNQRLAEDGAQHLAWAA
jgi:hypothetical protein